MAGVLRIGTRDSALATLQAESVRRLLSRAGVEVELRVVTAEPTTDGKERQASSGVKERFVGKLRSSLLDGEVDLAVHSLKDVPLQSPPEITLAAFPAQEDPRDAFVSLRFSSLRDMPAGGRIGTSSPRRVLILDLLRPDVDPLPLSGNVDTRLRRLREGKYDAVILALAGLRRMGLGGMVREALPMDRFVPAPGQGIIAVEVRKGDRRVLEALKGIDDPAVRARALAERTFCAAIGADCGTATGVVALQKGGTMKMEALHRFDPPGRVVRARITGSARDPEGLGEALAERMRRILRGEEEGDLEGEEDDG